MTCVDCADCEPVSIWLDPFVRKHFWVGQEETHSALERFCSSRSDRMGWDESISQLQGEQHTGRAALAMARREGSISVMGSLFCMLFHIPCVVWGSSNQFSLAARLCGGNGQLRQLIAEKCKEKDKVEGRATTLDVKDRQRKRERETERLLAMLAIRERRDRAAQAIA